MQINILYTGLESCAALIKVCALKGLSRYILYAVFSLLTWLTRAAAAAGTHFALCPCFTQ